METPDTNPSPDETQQPQPLTAAEIAARLGLPSAEKLGLDPDGYDKYTRELWGNRSEYQIEEMRVRGFGVGHHEEPPASNEDHS